MNRPRHPAEVEAWSLASSSGVWRGRDHPKWKDQRPALDWASARAAHDDAAAPWPQVRQLLLRLECGAREGRGVEGGDE